MVQPIPAAKPIIGKEEREAVDRVMQSGMLAQGPEVAAFAQEFGAALVSGRACVATNSGTSGLHLGLLAAGVGPGDEVIVPSFTFAATANSVALTGATPVFADIEPTYFCLDPQAVEAAITEKTKAVMPVHLFGHPANMTALQAIADKHGIQIYEDAAQAHGATWKGKRVGSNGALAGWSFYPSKNLGCFGDGGAVTGGDAQALARARLLANHGRIQHYEHGAVGTNSRLDALQAAVLNLRLPLLERDNERRRALAARYREGLAGIGGVRLLDVAPGAEPVYHQLVVRTAERDRLRQHLLDRQIGSAVFYPIPLHRQPALLRLLGAVEAPVAERAAAEVLALPLYPQLTTAQVDEVCAEVRAFFGG